jgi:hypothetical protein
MGRFWSHRRPGRPEGPARARRRRQRLPEVCALESRELTVITGIATTAVSQQILTPPDGRLVPVSVSGLVSNNLPDPPIAELHVIDEYRRVNVVRRLALTPQPGSPPENTAYDYSFTVHLEASRADQDRSGRHYYLTITVRDADNAGAQIVPVRVPHDRGQIPDPDAGAGDEVTVPPNARGRARAARAIMAGSARRTGRRGGSR